MARAQYSIGATTISSTTFPLTPGNCRISFSFRLSDATGTPKYRIYKQGDAAPAFANMPGDPFSPSDKLAKLIVPVTNDIYIVEYKDTARQQVIGKVNVGAMNTACLTSTSAQCYNTSVQIVAGPVATVKKGSIDNGTNYLTLDPVYGGYSFSNAHIVTLGIGNNITGVKFRTTTCGDVAAFSDFFIGQWTFVPMVVSYTVTSVTSNGGSDGAITLSITGGSGSRSYLWGDGPVTQNRSGLEAGSYTVTVTDITTGEVEVVVIAVPEPELVGNNGTFLIVPQMNSLTFVNEQSITPCGNPQGLDNVLLCEQEYEGFDQTFYFQKVNKCDSGIITQFNSDYSNFIVSLHNYINSELIKIFTYELKEENIGVFEDYGITIRDHTSIGQSRVYFNAGSPPIPLSVGDHFTILNNANGYNGDFIIVNVLNDTAFGYQYLVINKSFTGPGTSQSGTGRFFPATADFNVFESPHDFSDVDEGKYYIKITANDNTNNGNEKISISEPIDLRNNHEGTCLLKYRNEDNAFGMTWTTGYQGSMRLPSHFGHKRLPGGERSTNRNSDYSLVKINAKKTRVLLFELYSLPPYMHEKASVAFDCDSYSINNIICQSNEGYGEPQYKDRFLLASSSIKLETKWFDSYNSDDIGTVADGGFIETQTGFLRR